MGTVIVVNQKVMGAIIITAMEEAQMGDKLHGHLCVLVIHTEVVSLLLLPLLPYRRQKNNNSKLSRSSRTVI